MIDFTPLTRLASLGFPLPRGERVRVREIIFLTIILGLIIFSQSSFAQIQKGYSADDAPDVTVDRSVLEELKDYQPPPMFGGASEEITPTTKPVKLTPPSADSLLNHPIENTQVFTLREDDDAPAPVQAILSIPQGDIKPAKKIEPKKETKKEIKNPEKIIEKKVENKTEKKQEKAYRPQTVKTMPAVPPIPVERDTLPPLPSLPPIEESTSPPPRLSISERIIDASLADKLETDTDKIKEELMGNKPIATKVSKTSPQKSIVFKDAKNTDLTEEQKNIIVKNFLPEMKQSPTARIQILSFATSPDKSETNAKRIALTRALAVRDYLKGNGINTSRIDVKAINAPQGLPPANKVDFALISP